MVTGDGDVCHCDGKRYEFTELQRYTNALRMHLQLASLQLRLLLYN